MKRLLTTVALTCLLAAPASAEYIGWGKPGVSRPDYEKAGIDCSFRVATSDVSSRTETKDFVAGARVLEREANNMASRPNDDVFAEAERQVLLKRMYAPGRKVTALQGALQQDVEACLKNAGYVQFRLTRDQERRLGKLRPGSDARKAYLYSLGSDATVVEAQRVTDRG
jgi:hypothetical protein